MRRARWTIPLLLLLALLPKPALTQIAPMCAGCGPTYSVSVTPDGGTTPAATSGATGLSTTFTVANTGSLNTSIYDLTLGCDAPVSTCSLSKDSVILSAGSQEVVTVYYDVVWAGIGTIQLTAIDRDDLHESMDSGDRTVTVTGQGRPVISGGPQAASVRLTGACLAACFDAVYQRGGPAYVSMGAARGLSLVYNSSTHRSFPTVSVDVTKNAQTTSLPAYYRLEVRRPDGVKLKLANDSTFAYFSPAATGSTRLVAPIKHDTITGAYAVRVVVEAIYTGGSGVTYSDTLDTRYLVNNQRKSVYGAGVDLAGILRVFPAGSSALVTTGDGSILYYAGPSCGGCDYKTPGGASGRLSWKSATSTYRLTGLDSSFVEFNAQGRMLRSVDRFGNRDSLVWGGVGDTLLRAIIDPMGKRDSLCYGASCGTSGKLTEIRSLGGTAGARTMSLLHDGAGRLIRFTDPDGLRDSLAYNSDSLLAGVVNRGGNRTDFSYDALFRLDSVLAPSITLHDGSSGRPTVALNTAERAAWQPAVSGASQGTAKTGIAPDAARATMVDPLGATSYFTLDRFGSPTRVTDPFGVSSTMVHDTAGRVTQTSDSLGRSVSYTYNGYAVSRIVDNGGGITRTIDFTYDFSNYNLRTISGDVVRQDFHYYAADTVGGRKGALKKVYIGNQALPANYPTLTGASLVSTHRTDSRGRDSMALDSLGHGGSVLYEGTWGNVLKVIDPTGAEQRFMYTSRGLLDTTVVPLTGKSYFTYGTMNQVLTQGIVPAGTSSGRPVASYTYHPDLSLWVVQTPRPEAGSPVQYTYSYNAAGWLVYQGDPGGTSLLETFKYDLAGNLRTRVTRNGESIQMTYDAVGRLLTRSGPDFPTDNFSYDPLGRFQVSWNSVARDSMGFDIRGRLSGWKDSLNGVAGGRAFAGTVSYDALDRVTQRILSTPNPLITSTIKFIYANGTGRRDSLCVFAAASNKGCVTFKRNGDGAADTLVFNRGSSNAWRLYQGYDASHRITVQDYDLSGLAPFDLTQSYDSLGRVRNRTSPKGGSFTRRVFRYDSLGFLRNACDSTGSQCQNTVNGGTSGDAWTYDSTGNRTQVGTTDTYGNGNRLTALGSTVLTYDSTGSLVCQRTSTCPGGSGAGTKYGWDALGRLREIRNAFTGALIDSFAYDPLGRRVMKKQGTGGTEYYAYEGSQVVLDVDSAGNLLREYAWHPGSIDRLLALRTPTDTFAALLDPQTGSVRGLARFRTGGSVKEYAELPWGDVAADTGLTLRYRFAGREFDQESGLYYARARYYDPVTGRWVSEDPIGVDGGLNLYAYSGNDPVNRVDPSGTEWVIGECTSDFVGGMYTNFRCQIWNLEELTVIAHRTPLGGGLLAFPGLPEMGGGTPIGAAAGGMSGGSDSPMNAQEQAAPPSCPEAAATAFGSVLADASFFAGVGVAVRAYQYGSLLQRGAVGIWRNNFMQAGAAANSRLLSMAGQAWKNGAVGTAWGAVGSNGSSFAASGLSSVVLQELNMGNVDWGSAFLDALPILGSGRAIWAAIGACS